MTLVRETSTQQINTALQSMDKSFETYKKMVEAFLTLIAVNTSDEETKKQMIKVLKNDKDTLDKLIKQKEELLK